MRVSPRLLVVLLLALVFSVGGCKNNSSSRSPSTGGVPAAPVISAVEGDQQVSVFFNTPPGATSFTLYWKAQSIGLERQQFTCKSSAALTRSSQSAPVPCHKILAILDFQLHRVLARNRLLANSFETLANSVQLARRSRAILLCKSGLVANSSGAGGLGQAVSRTPSLANPLQVPPGHELLKVPQACPAADPHLGGALLGGEVAFRSHQVMQGP